PTFTADLAEAVRHLAVMRAPGVFHVTNQGATSWWGFARAIFAAAGHDPDRVVPIRTAELDPPRPAPRPALCLFEYIYFARPDSLIEGRRVYLARQEMGRELAREHPADADIVIGVPDSATQAALGYAEESGIPYAEGLVKNRYIHRTFIQPEQSMRQAAADLKYNPLPEVLGGKRVVVVDDSIVRGTTTGPLVRLLRRAGATEVHVRISSPPLRHPCYLGVDLAGYNDLIAARMDVEQIRRHIGADSLGYLSLGGLIEAIGLPAATFCNACFTGNYPIQVQLHLDKFALERADEEVKLTLR
ncbi:MAG: hypothetical protein C4289_12410, partial [Chloroflexota bacterium]